MKETINPLEMDERILEIARMLGGEKITDATMAHAREMLAGKSNARRLASEAT